MDVKIGYLWTDQKERYPIISIKVSRLVVEMDDIDKLLLSDSDSEADISELLRDLGDYGSSPQGTRERSRHASGSSRIESLLEPSPERFNFLSSVLSPYERSNERLDSRWKSKKKIGRNLKHTYSIEVTEEMEKQLLQASTYNFLFLRPILDHIKIAGGHMKRRMVRVARSSKVEEILSSKGSAVCVVSHENFYAIGCDDGSVLLFDWNDLLIIEFSIGNFRVLCLDVSVDGKYLIAVGSDCCLTVWSVEDQLTVRTVFNVLKHQVQAVQVLDASVKGLSCVLTDSMGCITILTIMNVFGFTKMDRTEVFRHIKLLAPIRVECLLPKGIYAAIGGKEHIYITRRSAVIEKISCDDHLPCFKWIYRPGNDMPLLAYAVGGKIAFKLLDTLRPRNESTISLCSFEIFPSCNIFSFHWVSSDFIVASSEHGDVSLVHFPSSSIVQTVSALSDDLNAVSASGYHTNGICITKDTAAFSVLTHRLWSWAEEAEDMASEGKWLDALSLGIALLSSDYYEYSLPMLTSRRQSVYLESKARPFFLDLLLQYVDTAVLGHKKNLALTKESAFASIEFCTKCSAEDFLFLSIYPRFKDVDIEYVFLESLLCFIMSLDTSKFVNVVLEFKVIHDLVSHLVNLLELQVAEQCIVRLMQFQNFSIDQIIKICMEFKLFTAMIMTFNMRLQEYAEPIVQISRAFTFLDREEAQVEYALKLISYLKCCFENLTYPDQQKMDAGTAVKVHNEVIQCVLSEPDILLNLLDIMPQDTLDILNTALENQKNMDPSECVVSIQEATQAVVSLTFGSKAQLSVNVEANVLYFIGLRIASDDFEAECDLQEKVLAFLFSGYVSSTKEVISSTFEKNDREDLIVKILSTKFPGELDSIANLNQASCFRMHKVSLLLYKQRKEFRKLVALLLESKDQICLLFSTLNDILVDESISKEDILAIRRTVLADFDRICKYSPDESVSLIAKHFHSDFAKIFSSLKDTRTKFRLIERIYSFNIGDDESLRRIPLTPSMHQEYLELMCQFQPKDVYGFLLSGTLEYDVDRMLTMCRQFGIVDASALLLERIGDVSRAIGLFQEHLRDLCQNVKCLDHLWMEQIRSVFHKMELLGVRISASMNEKSSEASWLRMLLFIIELLKERRAQQCSKDEDGLLVSSLSSFVSKMKGFVGHSRILQILFDPVSKLRFLDFQSFIRGMVDDNSVTTTIMKSAVNVFERDVKSLNRSMISGRSKAVEPSIDQCISCHRRLYQTRMESCPIVIFSCGHLFHKICTQSVTECPECLKMV